MLNFICFGSGSSGNCYYLYTEDGGIVIDTGVGIRTLKKHFSNYGLSLSDIKAILITHDHADHVKSVGSLSSDFFLPVYTTREVHKGIENNYCVRGKIKAGYERVITKNETFEIGEFHITPFHVPHDSTDNVGYKIEFGDITFCIMTDIGYVTDEMKPNIGCANYLVIESNYDREMLLRGTYPAYLKERIMSQKGHLSNHECATALVENATPELKHVWLAHLSEENNHPELARKTIEHELRSNGIIAGKDFELDVLKRKTPSEIYKLT